MTLKKAQNTPATYEQAIRGARGTLVAVLVFTVINVVLVACKANVYFLFSAYIPYMISVLGMIYCGVYPAEFYGEEGMEQLFDKPVLAVFLIIAAAILAQYLLSWILSKKWGGWLVFALVVFSLDTAAMLVISGIQLESILDILIHGLVIFSLARGVWGYFKLKKLPTETPGEYYVPAAGEPAEVSSVTGDASPDEKDGESEPIKDDPESPKGN